MKTKTGKTTRARYAKPLQSSGVVRQAFHTDPGMPAYVGERL